MPDFGKEYCAECKLCKFTRTRTKDSLLYRVARFVQKRCPACRAANEEVDRDFQQSDLFRSGTNG